MGASSVVFARRVSTQLEEKVSVTSVITVCRRQEVRGDCAGYCHLLQEVPGGEDPGLGPGLGPPAHPQLLRVRVRSLPAVITLSRVDAPNKYTWGCLTCDRQKKNGIKGIFFS